MTFLIFNVLQLKKQMLEFMLSILASLLQQTSHDINKYTYKQLVYEMVAVIQAKQFSYPTALRAPMRAHPLVLRARIANQNISIWRQLSNILFPELISSKNVFFAGVSSVCFLLMN